eukprot:TRINITY_DN414_c0_g1_i1.p1 TRINITY_DN414_c0_g1~~TRINITY_DN414_c0_g1_i1.p1  ORF type:complete len:134 (+),score=53.58 TRINITY_DN414_c0_g1_i1:49-402(+)
MSSAYETVFPAYVPVPPTKDDERYDPDLQQMRLGGYKDSRRLTEQLILHREMELSRQALSRCRLMNGVKSFKVCKPIAEHYMALVATSKGIIPLSAPVEGSVTKFYVFDPKWDGVEQ